MEWRGLPLQAIGKGRLRGIFGGVMEVVRGVYGCAFAEVKQHVTCTVVGVTFPMESEAVSIAVIRWLNTCN